MAVAGSMFYKFATKDIITEAKYVRFTYIDNYVNSADVFPSSHSPGLPGLHRPCLPLARRSHNVPTAAFVKQQIPGHDVLDVPCYSFFIENDKLGKKVLYDLGIMKAWMETLPPSRECYLSYHLNFLCFVTRTSRSRFPVL